jgi:predicted dehydrogenase
VVQTVGLGPHRLNRAIRPDWFFDKSCFGGILTDIASHQIDQFLHFTGSPDAEIAASGTGHFGLADLPDSRISARSCFVATGRTASSASTGSPPTACRHGATGGSPSSAPRARSSCENSRHRRPPRHRPCLPGRQGRHPPYRRVGRALDLFRNLIADIENRSETAATQRHMFTVCRLALHAQDRAVRLPVRGTDAK